MSVRKSLAWAFSGQITVFVLTFASSVILARLLSPREMGVFAVAVATSGVISLVANFGVGAYVIREVDLAPGKLDTAFTAQALINGTLAVSLFSVSWAGSQFLGDPGVGKVLRVFAIGPLISILEFRPSIMLQRNMQFKIGSLISTATAALNVVLTVLLANAGFSYMSMAYAGVGTSALSALAYTAVAREHVRFRFSLQGWRPIVGFGLQIMSISGVANLTQRVSDIVLGRTLGIPALGVYSRATGLSSTIFQNVYGTATRVIFVKLSKDFRERGVLRDSFLSGLDMILAVMWPFLIGLAVLSRPFMYILYGRKWLGAALPFSMLMIAQFISLSFGMNWELFVLRGETAKQTKYEITRSGIGFVLFCIGAMFSILLASLGRVLDATIGAIFYFPKMNRLAGTEPWELTRIYRNSLMLTAAAAGPSLALMASTGWRADLPIAWVLGAVGAGVLGWLAVLRLLHHALLDELARFLRVAFAKPLQGRLARRAAG